MKINGRSKYMYNKIRFKWYDLESDKNTSDVRYFPEGFKSKLQGLMKLIVKLTYEYNMYFRLSDTYENILIIDCESENKGGVMYKGVIHKIEFSQIEYLDLKDLN